MEIKFSPETASGNNSPLLQTSCQIIQLTDDLPNDQLVELRNFTSHQDCQCLAHIAEVIQKIRQLNQYTFSCTQDADLTSEVHVLLHNKMSQIEHQVIQILIEYAQGQHLVDEIKRLRVEYNAESISHD